MWFFLTQGCLAVSALACAPGPWSMLNNTCAMPSVAQEDAAQHVRWQLGWSTSQVRMVRILVSICFNLFQPTCRSWQDIGVQHHGRCGSSLGFEIDRRAVSFIRFISTISMRSMMIYATIALGTSHLYQPISVY